MVFPFDLRCESVTKIHSKIEKLYAFNVVELIYSIWNYYYIMTVSLTVPGKVNQYGEFKLLRMGTSTLILRRHYSIHIYKSPILLYNIFSI